MSVLQHPRTFAVLRVRLLILVIAALLASGMSAVVHLSIPSRARADDSVWLGPDRSRWPDTEFRKTKNDFAALLLVTPDLDWQRKWNTPPDTIPRFRQAKTMRIGERVVILTFFVNPKIDEHREAHVRCSIRITRPDQTVAVNQQGIACLEGELKGNLNYVRMSPAVIEFLGEATDPLGEWVVDVEVEDVVRNTTLPLRVRVTLLGQG
jgi:hypothetical protein